MLDLTGTTLATGPGNRPCYGNAWVYINSAWVDLSDYVESIEVVTEASAREYDANPSGHGAAAEATITLGNGARTWTPWNTAGAYYAYLKHRNWKRLPIRVKMGYYSALNVAEGVYNFAGYLEDYGVSVNGKSVAWRCLDGSCRLSGFKGRTKLYRNVRTDEFLQHMIDAIPSGIRPTTGAGTLSLEAGDEILPWAWWDGENWWEDAQKVAAADGGRLYFMPNAAGNPMLVFECGTHLMGAGHATAVDTFTVDNIETLQASGRWLDFYNAVLVRWRPYRMVNTTVIWESEPGRYSVKPGQTRNILATFQYPVYSLIPPKLDVDFVGQTPGGTKKTAATDVEVTVDQDNSLWAQQCIVAVTNHTSYTLRMTKLQLRGRQIVPDDEEETVLGLKDDGTYIDDLTGVSVNAGWRVLSVDAASINQYIQSSIAAKRTARMLLDRFGPVTTAAATALPNAVMRMNLNIGGLSGRPWLWHGDRNTVSEIGGELASDFFIQRTTHTFANGVMTTAVTDTPAAGMWSPNVFIMGTDALAGGKVYAP